MLLFFGIITVLLVVRIVNAFVVHAILVRLHTHAFGQWVFLVAGEGGQEGYLSLNSESALTPVGRKRKASLS